MESLKNLTIYPRHPNNEDFWRKKDVEILIQNRIEKIDLQQKSMKEDYGEDPKLWRIVPKYTYMELKALKSAFVDLLG